MICVYMPDSSRRAEEVDEIYLQLDEAVRGAKSEKMKFCICGDMNAQIGSRSEFDDQEIVGQQ